MYRMVMIEDNPVDVELAKIGLGEGGYDTELLVTTSAHLGRALLTSLAAGARDEHPDLIVLDLDMPGADGRELLEFATREARLRRIPVVILTSCTDPERRDECLRLGASAYFVKPTYLDEWEQLATDLEDIINGRRRWRVPQRRRAPSSQESTARIERAGPAR